MGEAADVAELGHDDRGRVQLEAPQAHDGLHRGIVPPLRHLHLQEFVEPLHPLGHLVDREQLFLQHRAQRGQRQRQLPQVALVGLAPVGFTRVAIALP